MIKLYLILLCSVLFSSCSKELSENEKRYKVLTKYLKIQGIDNQLLSDNKQIVVIPSSGCGYCINKALLLYEEQNWDRTQFVTNNESEHCGEIRFICDSDKKFLNSLNLKNDNKPIVFQLLENQKIKTYLISSGNWNEIYIQVKTFDKL